MYRRAEARQSGCVAPDSRSPITEAWRHGGTLLLPRRTAGFAPSGPRRQERQGRQRQEFFLAYLASWRAWRVWNATQSDDCPPRRRARVELASVPPRFDLSFRVGLVWQSHREVRPQEWVEHVPA